MVDIRGTLVGPGGRGAGEDPYLGSAVAVAKVRGDQGSNFGAPEKMAATIKHFAAYGARSPAARAARSTCRLSSCSTIICRRLRRRSTRRGYGESSFNCSMGSEYRQPVHADEDSAW